MSTRTYAAAVYLRHTDGRSHSVCVVLQAAGPDEAVDKAEGEAMGTIAMQIMPGWSVQDSHLFDQVCVEQDLRSCTTCGLTVDLRQGHVAPAADTKHTWRGKQP